MKTSKGFKFFTGDVNWLDYGGTWIRRVTDTRFHFLRVENMDYACGRDNEGSPTYCVELAEVDLEAISAKNKASALESCGYELDGDITPEIQAGACFEYGSRAPLHSVSTNNAYAGFRECRRESYSLTRDSEAMAERLARPVNGIGSTALEYMTGD